MVPGLAANPFASFTYRDRPGENWLRDYLPVTSPSIRVLVYGYHIQIAGGKRKLSINDIARGFLESVVTFRRSSVGITPRQITEVTIRLHTLATKSPNYFSRSQSRRSSDQRGKLNGLAMLVFLRALAHVNFSGISNRHGSGKRRYHEKHF